MSSGIVIAAYHGTSPLSWLIRGFEKARWFPGDVSHISAVDLDDEWAEYEAWSKGVTKAPFGKHHAKGTVVDLYRVHLSDNELELLREFLMRHVGDKYDWRGLFRFITHRPEDEEDQDRWFCAEYIFAGLLFCGLIALARIPAYKVFPELILLSPYLSFWKTVKIGDPYES